MKAAASARRDKQPVQEKQNKNASVEKGDTTHLGVRRKKKS